MYREARHQQPACGRVSTLTSTRADDDSGRTDQPHSLALFMVRGFGSRRYDRRDHQPPPLVSEFSPCVLWSIVDRDRFVHGLRARSDSASRRTSGAKSRALASDATDAVSDADTRHRHWHNRLVPRRRYGLRFAALSWPQYAWVAAALVLVVLMTIQGIGYLLPTNLRVCLELQKDNPDNARIGALTNR